MQNPTHPIRARNSARPVAIVVAGALAASALALAVPTSADAASGSTTNITNASFSWGFNNYSGSYQFTLGALSGNAAADPTLGNLGFTLSQGQGWIDSSNTGEIDFDGSATIDYGHAGPGTFVFSDFVLTIQDGTRGTLAADVSSTYTDTSLTVPVATDDVTIASFDIASLETTGGTLALQTAAPDWAGVAITPPTGGTAQDVTTSGWGAWPQSFISVLSRSVASFFYSTSTGGFANKQPAALSATGTLSTPTAVVTSSYPAAGGLDVTVVGSGFAALNAGLYIGVGPTGLDLARTNEMAYQSNFLAAAWVATSQIAADGSFTSTLHVPTASLTSTGSYSVYTWNAHAHTTVANDTTSALPFSYSSLADVQVPVVQTATSTTLAPSASKPTYGKAITLTATVGAGVTGTIAFTVDGAPLGTVPVTDGVATIRTNARTAVGSHAIAAAYSGDATHLASSAASAYKVAKDPSTVKVTAKRYARGKAPVVKVKLGALPTGEHASGKVKVKVNGKVVRTVTVRATSTSVSVKLPKSYGEKKSIRVQARYLGSAKSAVAVSKKVVVRVKR